MISINLKPFNVRGGECLNHWRELGGKYALTERMRVNKPKWIPYGDYNRLHPWWEQGGRWNRRNEGFRSGKKEGDTGRVMDLIGRDIGKKERGMKDGYGVQTTSGVWQFELARGRS